MRAGIGHGVVLGVLVAQLCGCATGWEGQARGPVEQQNPLQAELGFVRAEGARRSDVESRLGPAPESFESGRIVGYPVFYDVSRRRLAQVATPPGPRPPQSGMAACFGLMIEYAPDGAILRHALIRQGSAWCPKGMAP